MATPQGGERDDEVPLLQQAKADDGEEAETTTGQVLPVNPKEKPGSGKERKGKPGSAGKSKKKKESSLAGSSGKWLLESSGEESADGGQDSSEVTATGHCVDGEDDWVEIKTSTPGKKYCMVKGHMCTYTFIFTWLFFCI